ncbi:MAG: hypothetical protein LWY06_07700 [Firmicutes bacterium]|nr:hypothetical protein [Bacillota bacterium]
MAEKKESLLSEIITKLPWTDFFWALFLPLNLMQIAFKNGKPLLGIELLSACCIIYFVYYLIRFKKVSLFPVFTLLITLEHFAVAFFKLPPQPAAWVNFLADAFSGIPFLITLFMAKPMILYFIDENSLKHIPEKIRQSPVYMQTWKIVTAIWGFAYIITAIMTAWMKNAHLHYTETFSMLTGWPMVAVLLIVSVIFPKYWLKKKFPGK